jgi:hypothetical protein
MALTCAERSKQHDERMSGNRAVATYDTASTVDTAAAGMDALRIHPRRNQAGRLLVVRSRPATL